MSREKSPKKGRKKDAIEQFIGSHQMLIKPGLSQLRYMILADGLNVPEGYETCPYRCYVWSILLRVQPINTNFYLELVSKGPPSSYSKVRNDTFRTLAKDETFNRKVHENSLVRVLSAFAWTQEKNNGINEEVLSPYVQGMNILAAPFLFVCKSEPEAFAMFYSLLTKHLPLYITPTLDGVYTGANLVDIILKIVDPKLQSWLNSKLLKPEMYAFPSVLTLSTCTPPLSEILILWDFLFAYGCHMNILLVVAQLVLIRSQLLESKSPMSLLRNFPPIKAKEIIKLSISFVTKIPSNIYDLLVRHTYDPRVKLELQSLG
ncbi:Bub2 protein [Saccharomycopsis crataegensis]|uniref:Bub2 protein n=1 Tax=Saccharomycopsis crataegensis TaxID=43959 RepID=A0AAV5QTR6_9ASCO|nr:Bub2 protein [Saccharomycopsis crataegensis]